jgi:hypothetical protein
MDTYALKGFSDELEKIASLEKEAITPISLLLAGVGSHLGSNVITKALHHTKPLMTWRKRSMGRGIRQSLSGDPRGIESRMAETWIGPDYAVSEEIGRRIGNALRDRSKGQQYRALKKMRKAVAEAPASVRSLPIMEDLIPGINRALETPLPNVGVAREATRLQKAAPYAVAPLAALEPGLLVHMGINKMRSAIARSRTGKQYLKDTAMRGVQESPLARKVQNALPGVFQNKIPSPRQERLRDMGVGFGLSPATLAPKNLAKGLSSAVTDPSQARSMRRLTGAFQTLAGSKANPLAGVILKGTTSNTLAGQFLKSSSILEDVRPMAHLLDDAAYAVYRATKEEPARVKSPQKQPKKQLSNNSSSA